MSSKFSKFLGIILFFLTLITRFYQLDWGDGYYFHPDENNMAFSISQMEITDLNPHFFAYGQFPLFLTFFTTPSHDFSSIILTLRFWSALFSSFSVLFFYLIIRQFIKNPKIIFFAVLLFIFTPGLIQSAHFGTTESIMLLVFLINIYFSLKIFSNFQKKYIILAALVSGIGLATKISSLILTTPILLSLLFIFLKNKRFFQLIFSGISFLFSTFLISLLFSPFNILDFSSFKSSIFYEVGVANGSIQVFYTRQFLNTIPYFFQIQKIFPYTIGLPVFLLSFLGLFIIIKSFFKNKFDNRLLLVLIPSLIFFSYQGQLFTKWTRFMCPIFFIFPFLATFFLSKIKNIFLLTLFIVLSISPGIIFFQKYFHPDIRVQASNWMNSNIPPTSKILSESGNVINLPIGENNFDVTNFDFYQLDDNLKKQEELNRLVDNTDYIIIPSRRVFKNQNNPYFPESQLYYQKLFSNESGFSEIKKFYLNNSFFLNPENAEETWSVFDNPTIRLYQKI